jgi:6-pyruvoyltetrahydropterin/6-carboxytetrahydropterin synthase
MAEITVTKEFTWCMAHMLANHEGLCKNIHGHTYKLQVEIKRLGGGLIVKPENTEHGMVMEFADLKNIINDAIVEPLDHAFLYWKDSPDSLEIEIANLLIKNGRKVVEIDYRPTAENMAISFKNILSEKLKSHKVLVASLIVWESPTSFAKVS